MSQQLNPQQLEACQNTEGPLLVLAGAGTGKTRVLTQRMAHIIDQGLAYPSQIMAVTFTNKAANEMLVRTESIVESSGIWIGTFHSLATKIIRNHTDSLGIAKEFTIIDVDDQWRILKKIINEKNIDEKLYPPKIIAAIIGRWKDMALFPEDVNVRDATTEEQKKARLIYPEYQDRLRQLNAVDFGDLLLFCLKLFKEFPQVLGYYQDKFRYIMVDEYQDTNVIQYLWLRYLSQQHNNICAVGDEDQSIYGWRGAEIRNIMKFTHDFKNAKIIRLEQNYRSTRHILATANHLITHNKIRMGKNLWTDCQSEEKVKITAHINGYKEAESIVNNIKNLSSVISRNEMAILVRASFQTRIIEEVLIQNQIAYKIMGGLKFYDRLEVKNALAYIKLAYNFNDSLAFERIINFPKRGIGISTVAQIQTYANENQCSYFVATQMMLKDQSFRGKTQSTLTEFVNQLEAWNKLWQCFSCREVSCKILNECGYITLLEAEVGLDAQSRLENLNELLRNIGEFKTISDFLEHVSLANDVDKDDSNNMVKIMTMHAAKGLEFSVVFLPGWEEGVFPSKRSIAERDGLEEERRLAYVAITRAKQRLFISHANSRQVFGDWQHNAPSRFINEVKQLSSTEESMSKTNYLEHNFKSNNNLPVWSPGHGKFLKLATGDNDVAQENKMKFNVGDIVNHQKFGKGRVTAIDGQHADIDFSSCGNKRIMNNFITKI